MALLALLAGYIIINVLTASWFPPPWRDEVAYSDPAIRFVMGKGFTSAAWSSQSINSFWAANSPLHEILLVPWLMVFGVNLVAVRTFDIVLCALSVYLIWIAAKRNHWVLSTGWRLIMCLLLLAGYGLFLVARSGRPDGITLLVGAILVSKIDQNEIEGKPPTWHWVRIITAMAVPWAGLQLAVGIGATCTLGLAFDWQKYWRCCAEIAGGIVAGFLLLLLFFYIHGQGKVFLELTLGSGHTVTGQIAQYVMIHDVGARNGFSAYLMRILQFTKVWTIDPSYLSEVLMMIALLAYKRIDSVSMRMLKFGILGGLATPLVLLIAGKYPRYYAWMGQLVVTIVAIGLVSRLWGSANWKMRLVIVVPLTMSFLVGAPLAFGKAASNGFIQIRELDDYVRNNVVSSDRVIVASAAYFSTLGRVSETYTAEYGGGHGFRELPRELKDGVTVLIINPGLLNSVESKIGGGWIAGPTFTIPGVPFFEDGQQLVVFRRRPVGAR